MFILGAERGFQFYIVALIGLRKVKSSIKFAFQFYIVALIVARF